MDWIVLGVQTLLRGMAVMGALLGVLGIVVGVVLGIGWLFFNDHPWLAFGATFLMLSMMAGILGNPPL